MFFLYDSKRMFRAIEDPDTGETKFVPMNGHKVVLLHGQTLQFTTITASWSSSGPSYAIKAPPASSPVKGSWEGKRTIKQHVKRFPGTEMFKSHIRERYPDLAKDILSELGVE